MPVLGSNAIGGTPVQQAPGHVVFCSFVAATSFVADRLLLYSQAAATPCLVTLGIYTDNAGAVGAKLGTTVEAALSTTAGWISANLTANVTITAGQTYWLAVSLGSNSCNQFYSTAAFNSVYVTTPYVSGSLPASNPSTTAWFTNREFSIYAAGSAVQTEINFTDANGNAITTLSSNHGAGTIAVKAVNPAGSWTGAELLSLSGVPNWSISSATFVDASHYTLVLSCPAAASPPSGTTGTLTVSDATNSLAGSLNISTPTLAISPAMGATGMMPALTFTGTNTLWTDEMAASLLAISGGVNSALGTPSVTSNTSATATLTVGTAAGTLTITDTSTGATAAFTATTNTIIPVTDANLQFDPFAFWSDGAGALQSNNLRAGSTKAICNNPGNGLEFNCTTNANGSIAICLDMSGYSGLTSGQLPVVGGTVDGVALPDTTLSYSASPVQLTLASGLSAGPHSVEFYFKALSDATADRFNIPTCAVVITGVYVDGTLGPPTLRSKTAIFYGDSITEGRFAINSSGTDATSAYSYLLAWALDAKYGNIAFASQGWTRGGTGNVPAFPQAWNMNFSGQPRLFSPQADYVFINHGQNDTNDADVATAVAGNLPNVRATNPSAWIFVIVPFTHQSIVGITNGFNSYQASTPDAKCVLIDLGTVLKSFIVQNGLFSSDGVHPNTRGHAVIATMLAEKVQATIGGQFSVGSSVVVRGTIQSAA